MPLGELLVNASVVALRCQKAKILISYSSSTSKRSPDFPVWIPVWLDVSSKGGGAALLFFLRRFARWGRAYFGVPNLSDYDTDFVERGAVPNRT